MAQQVHGPAISSQGEFHVMCSQLESFQLVGFVQGKEPGSRSDSHSRQKLVNVILVLVRGNCKQKKGKEKKLTLTKDVELVYNDDESQADACRWITVIYIIA